MATNLSNFLNSDYLGYTGSRGFVGYTGSRGSLGFTGSVGRGSYFWKLKNSTYTAQTGDTIVADTSSSTFTILLPATPVTGDSITIADGYNFSINSLIIGRNGSLIENQEENLIIDIQNARVELVYNGYSWQVYANIGQIGFAGSKGTDGNTGFTGSRGFTGSAGINGTNATVTITNDTSSSSTQYVTFVGQTSGIATAFGVSDSKLYYNPNTGTLNATEFNTLSDATLKENISPISNSFDLLDMINTVEFNWKDSGQKSYGVLAQQLEKIMPELVRTNEHGIKSVSYIPLIALLIDTVKQLKKQIEEK